MMNFFLFNTLRTYILKMTNRLARPEMARGRRHVTSHSQVKERAMKMKMTTLNACVVNSASLKVSPHRYKSLSISSSVMVLLTLVPADLDSHLEMHSAEGTGFDDFGRATMEDVPALVLSRGDTSSSDSDTPPRTPPRESPCLYDNRVPIGALVDAGTSPTIPHQDRIYGDIRRLSTSPTRRHKSKISDRPKRHKPTKRLGVRISFYGQDASLLC